MKYYSENLDKVFDTIDELNKAEKELSSKEEKRTALANEIKELTETIEKLQAELDEKKTEYSKLSKPVGHYSVRKNGKTIIDEDIGDRDTLFNFYHILNMLR